MSSSIGRNIDTIIESTSYDKYLWETVEINEELNTYALEFTHENNSDSAAKLVLALGKVAGQDAIGEHVVTIDNVYLYEIPALPTEGPAEPPPPKEGYGVGTIKENSVEFYVNDAPWAIIHYIKNGTTQQNIMMNKAGENYSVYTLNDVNEGDEIKYWFTYGLAEGGQDEYGEQTYTHKFVTTPETPTANEVSDQSTEVTGKAEAASLITVSNGKEEYTATADAEGVYAVTIPKQPAGTVLTITATDEAGNVSEELSVTVTGSLEVNEVTVESKEVIGKAKAGSVVTVELGTKNNKRTGTVDSDGTFNVKIPKQKAGTIITISVEDVDGNITDMKNVSVVDHIAPSAPNVKKVDSNSTSVTGKTEANAQVTVKVGEEVIGTSKADEKGDFEVKIDKQEKSTVLSVTATDAENKTSEATKVTVK